MNTLWAYLLKSESYANSLVLNFSSVLNDVIANLCKLGPCGKSHFYAAVGNINATSPVSTLLHRTSPSAIFRGVSKIVVYAVDTVTIWAITHVFVKVFKTLPSFAYCNSAPFVTNVISASSNHGSPDGVLARWVRTFANPCGVPVRFAPTRRKLSIETSARLRITAQQIRSGYGNGISTIAQAIPLSVAVFGAGKRNNSKPTKFFTNHIFCGCHDSPVWRVLC